MKTKLIYNATNFLAFKDMLKQIPKEEKNIIIVPDKFSLNAEKMFFEENNIMATFSTQVFSITKLASKVLSDKLSNKKLIDKNISLMIISSIISENLNNFKYFKNIKDINKITEDIFNVISQMLSSNFNSVSDKIDGNLKLKFEDLNLILNEYKIRREDYLIDASKKYDLFLNEIKNSAFLKERNVYFGMFNSLTTQVKNIIKEISLYCKSACFSTSYSTNKVNNNEIFDFFKSLNPVLIKGQSKTSDICEFIENNFFSKITNKKEVDNKVKLFEAKNVDEEVENLVLEIKKDILLNNRRFKDIGVVLSNIDEYKDKIITKLSENNITYFLDSSIKLQENSYAKFILEFVSLLNFSNVSKYISFIKNYYINIDENIKNDFVTFLEKYSLYNLQNFKIENSFKKDKLFNNFLFVFENYIKKIEELKNKKFTLVSDFFNEFNNILLDFCVKDKLNEKIESLMDTDILKYKQFKQVEDKIKDAEQNIIDFYKEEFSFKKLENFMKICFNNAQISVPATSVDSVFVGDYLNSYFCEYKKLYILGANSESFPSLMPDVSLFTDSELIMLEKDEKIEPKLKDTNKLNYYKAFNSIFNFTEELSLSYSLTNKRGARKFPSLIYKNFLKCFDCNNEQILPIKIYSEVLNNFENSEILNLLSFKYNYKTDYLKRYFSLENSKEKDILFNILTKFYKISEKDLKIDEKPKNILYLDKINKNLINLNKFSASSLENYFVCPNKFLYKEILKLNKIEPLKLDARVFGNIVHECAYKLAQEIFKQKQENIDKNLLTTNETFINQSEIKNNENIKDKDFNKSNYAIKNEINIIEKKENEIDEKIENNTQENYLIDLNKINIENLIESVFNSDKYINYKKLENSVEIFNNLKEEIKKLFVFIVNQQNNSSFKISRAEHKFNFTFNNILFSGFVDRIDETEDEFIVIDYKTGSTKIDYFEIIFGKKVQLILYAKILEEVLNKKCAGVYYLSVNDDFSTNDKLKIYLNGITKNADNNIFKLDNLVSKEDGIKSEYFDFNEKFILSPTQFENLLNKIFEKVLDAINKIKSGEFGANVLMLSEKCACEYCDYAEICNQKNENKVELLDDIIDEILNGKN